MKATTAFFIILEAALALAQCEAPVPCTDATLLALEESDCQKHHIFVARGSDSGYPGHNGVLIRTICERLKDCGYENIVYPANSTAAGPDMWCKSAAIGARHAQEQLTSYSTRCPDSKLIVLGFSQGGSVALDALGGGGGTVFQCVQENNPALDRTKTPGSKIAAAVVFGAVVRTAGQPYTAVGTDRFKGGEDYNGTSPRSDAHLTGLNQYSDILRDYCNFGDPICAKGSTPEDVDQHLNYFELYTEEAAEWVIETVQRPLGLSSNVKSEATTSGAPKDTVSRAGKKLESFYGTVAVAVGISALSFCV